MPRFSEQFILQVQQATDIVELVSQYLALKRSGREFLGLCPFHQDKHPSMNVSPAKQIFKCFACGAGGSVFNFVMLYDKQTFPEAVRALAQRANIPVPQDQGERPTERGMSKNDLLEVTAFAAEFFKEQLQTPAGEKALAYAHGRGITDESIDRFGLGYAPDAWDSFLKAAKRRRFSEAQLVAAGMVVRRENSNGCYDRFRNRLIFPILDLAGKVVAFGGRAMTAEERAKYLNSSESPLFDKSGQLYALNWARESVVASQVAVVVEGYLDALIPIQAGVTNVVATLGTALTEGHVRLLARYAREVVLVFDADAAGAAAAERALELFLSQQVNVRVATIPAGKDPCDYCLSDGPDALRQLIDSAPDALQYAWDRRKDDLLAAGDNLAGRREVVEQFLRLVVASSTYGAIDAVRRGQLAQHIGHMLNIPAGELQQIMRRLARRSGGPAAGVQAGRDAGQAGGILAARVERDILEVLINRPDLYDTAAERIDPNDFDVPELRVLAQAIWQLGADGALSLEALGAKEALVPYGPLIAELITEGEQRENYENTLLGAVDRLAYRRRRRQERSPKEDGYSADALRRIQRGQGADVLRRPSVG